MRRVGLVAGIVSLTIAVGLIRFYVFPQPQTQATYPKIPPFEELFAQVQQQQMEELTKELGFYTSLYINEVSSQTQPATPEHLVQFLNAHQSDTVAQVDSKMVQVKPNASISHYQKQLAVESGNLHPLSSTQIASILQLPDDRRETALSSLLRVIDTNIEKLAAIEVPLSDAAFHRQYLGLALDLRAALELMQRSHNDPIGQLLATTTIDRLSQSFQNLSSSSDDLALFFAPSTTFSLTSLAFQQLNIQAPTQAVAGIQTSDTSCAFCVEVDPLLEEGAAALGLPSSPSPSASPL